MEELVLYEETVFDWPVRVTWRASEPDVVHMYGLKNVEYMWLDIVRPTIQLNYPTMGWARWLEFYPILTFKELEPFLERVLHQANHGTFILAELALCHTKNDQPNCQKWLACAMTMIQEKLEGRASIGWLYYVSPDERSLNLLFFDRRRYLSDDWSFESLQLLFAEYYKLAGPVLSVNWAQLDSLCLALYQSSLEEILAVFFAHCDEDGRWMSFRWGDSHEVPKTDCRRLNEVSLVKNGWHPSLSLFVKHLVLGRPIEVTLGQVARRLE